MAPTAPDAAAAPRFSIVVPTIGREVGLRALLAALAAQRPPAGPPARAW